MKLSVYCAAALVLATCASCTSGGGETTNTTVTTTETSNTSTANDVTTNGTDTTETEAPTPTATPKITATPKAAVPAPKMSTPKSATSKTITTPSGLKYEDTVVGKGAVATAGQNVTVHYRGKLTNGTIFDESYKRGQPFDFPLGGGQVIKGWDEGVAGMRVGGKRKLTIPSELGYGASGAGNTIPPNATLVFDVELLKVG